ncbi:trace amine-associated receptor 13c-like [Diadema setosum]|uniref:trace amine-associated receptor 13c-like n=1 Tax=Diadema setosum TaxID=31175 RepID=UPI003B3BDBCD
MTVADLLVGLVCMPIRALIFAFDRTWMLGGTFCYIFIGVQNALPGVSVFGVVVICFDRYLATSYPLHHYRWKTKKTAVVVNALTWFIPCSIWLSISTFWDLARPSGAVTRSGWCDPNYSSCRVPMSMNIGERNSVTAPKPRPDPLLEGITTAGQGEKRISDGSKALRTLAFLVVAFYLTWFLNTLNIILRSAAPAWFTSLVFEVQLRESGRWISYCNSTLNPLAYTLAQPLLRRTIRKMFCKKCQF